MTYVSREHFLKVKDFNTADIDVPKIGVIKLRGMTVKELQQFIRIARDLKPSDNDDRMDAASEHVQDALTYLVICGCIDEHDNNLFTMSDSEVLSMYSIDTLRPIAEKVLELSGMDKTYMKDGNDKNF